MTVQGDPGGDFGGRLRRLREKRSVTLRQIAAATNIPVGQLEALERNDIGRVPGGIFLRAIVRSYAQEVGADPELIVRDLIASFPEDATGVSQASQIDYEKATTPRRGLRGVLVAVVMLVVLVVAGLIWLQAYTGR